MLERSDPLQLLGKVVVFGGRCGCSLCSRSRQPLWSDWSLVSMPIVPGKDKGGRRSSMRRFVLVRSGFGMFKELRFEERDVMSQLGQLS